MSSPSPIRGPSPLGLERNSSNLGTSRKIIAEMMINMKSAMRRKRRISFVIRYLPSGLGIVPLSGNVPEELKKKIPLLGSIVCGETSRHLPARFARRQRLPLAG
jgi:hypothetical protein